jgi:hypothetical protein
MIAFLTPMEETRAHLWRRANAAEAHFRQRRRGKRRGRVSPQSKLISGRESFYD